MLHTDDRGTLEERFWSKVWRLPGCWSWLGATNDGYGVVHYPGKNTTIRAHVLSYTLCKGEVPSGMCVLHSCDNRECCNPDHLFVGTRGDNNRDRAQKKRCRNQWTGKEENA